MSSGPTHGQHWGPSHQTARRSDRGLGPKWFRRPIQMLLIAWLITGSSVPLGITLLACWLVIAVLIQMRIEAAKKLNSPNGLVNAGDPMAAVHAATASLGGGAYLGVDAGGGFRLARAERAVLVLGPPRSGKSSGVLIPAILAHPSAAVSASTKPDIMEATVAARSQLGSVWSLIPRDAAQGP